MRLLLNPWFLLGAVGMAIALLTSAYLKGRSDENKDTLIDQLEITEQRLQQIQEANDAENSFAACAAIDGYGVSVYFDFDTSRCEYDQRSDRLDNSRN
jgi:hypothetical protein